MVYQDNTIAYYRYTMVAKNIQGVPSIYCGTYRGIW